MDFKVRKIPPGKGKGQHKIWRFLLRTLGVKATWFIIMVSFVSASLYGGVLVYEHISGEEVRPGSIFTTPLELDTHGHTNLLLLGVAGEEKEGGVLSDSILVVSIDPEIPTVGMLSLPRDLYIPSDIGEHKINEIYAIAHKEFDEKKAREVTKKAIGDFIGIPMHSIAVVSFDVFKDSVDTLGGVDVFVPEEIIDPFYPGENYSYQTFTVRKGMQHFDGETALKYARSRKTTSDYSRAQRQQDLLMAIKNKAAELNLLTDFDKLKGFYDLFKQNVSTDLSFTQMVGLAKVGVAVDFSTVVNAVLNDDPSQKGGFLYTPAQEFYGGQFVLLPRDTAENKRFMGLLLSNTDAILERAQIEILNASEVEGLARSTAVRLRRMGLHVIEIGNYEGDTPISGTVLEYKPTANKPKTLAFLTDLFDATARETLPLSVGAEPQEGDLVDITLILGDGVRRYVPPKLRFPISGGTGVLEESNTEVEENKTEDKDEENEHDDGEEAKTGE